MARWDQIAADLRQQIADGTLPAGARLPTEEQLAAHYGVSRDTIRKALALLTTEGLLIARPRLGTFVRQAPVMLTVARYATEAGRGPWETACARRGIDGNAVLIEVAREHADTTVAARLNVALGAAVVRRTRQMLADGVVRQVQVTWIPAAVADGTPLAEPVKLAGGVYAALTAAGHPPARGWEEVHARMPSATERTELGLRPGQPVTEQWRTTMAADGTVLEATCAVSAHVVYAYDVPVP